MKFLPKSFGGSEKSRTFAPANQEHLLTSTKRKEFFERFTQTEVVQEARAEMLLGRRNKPFNS